MKTILLVLVALATTAYGEVGRPRLRVKFDNADRNATHVAGSVYDFAILPTSVSLDLTEGQLSAEESVKNEAMKFIGSYYLQARDNEEIVDPENACLLNWEDCTKGATIVAFINPDNPFHENSGQETLFRLADSMDSDTELGLVVSISRKKISVRAVGDNSNARVECDPSDVQGPGIIAMGWIQLAVRIQTTRSGDPPRADAIKLLINENLMSCTVNEPQVDIPPPDRRERTIFIGGDAADRMPKFGPYYGLMDDFQFYTSDIGISGVRELHRNNKERLKELNAALEVSKK